MESTTLGFLINEEKQILLGRKKRGFGIRKWNGFGGKLQCGEMYKKCMKRELYEESGLMIEEDDLVQVAYFDFQFPFYPQWTHDGVVYIIHRWKGELRNSDEMEPRWFSVEEIPYDEMWKGDQAWLPLLLDGKKVAGRIVFGEDNESIIEMELQEVDGFTNL